MGGFCARIVIELLNFLAVISYRRHDTVLGMKDCALVVPVAVVLVNVKYCKRSNRIAELVEGGDAPGQLSFYQ